MLSRGVDTLGNALRQYAAVPADTTTTSTASVLAVDIRQFPWIRRLASDYAYDYARVEPFFAGDPATPAAWADTIRRSQSTPRRPAELAAVLANQQARRGAPAEARAAAARLADPATRVVITGQQAGLFGGPLFTLLKALTSMKLAAEVERDHGVPVVPVFWIDAEDHDWAEVSGCTVLDAELAPHVVRLPDLPGAGERPIARLALTDEITAAIDDLAAALPDTEFRAEVIEGLRRAYQPGRGMAEAFGHWMETVLGPHGLVVYDSSDPAAKPLARHIFVKEIAEPGKTAELASRGRPSPGRAGLSLAGDAARRRHLAVPPGVEPRSHQGRGRPRHDWRRTHHAAATGRRSRTDAGALQPQRAAPADRAGRHLPHHLLRGGAQRARLSRASCATSTRTSGSRCR